MDSPRSRARGKDLFEWEEFTWEVVVGNTKLGRRIEGSEQSKGRKPINEALSRKCLMWGIIGDTIVRTTLGSHINRCLRMILLDRPRGWSIYLPVFCLLFVEIDLGSIYFPACLACLT